VRVLRAGNPRQAIEQFDAVIAEYEASARGSARFVFSSRWPVETLSYLLEVANNQKTAPGGAAVFGPSWGDAYYLKAFAFVELKQPSDARAALERAIALAPRNSQYRSELGNLQLAEKNWTDALETFRTAEAAARAVSPPAIKNSDLTRALRGQGYAMVELGRLEEAEKLYLQCLEIDPKDARAAGELKYLRQRRAAAPTAS
jgi:tetratricopeptide (TPR) repeat protein